MLVLRYAFSELDHEQVEMVCLGLEFGNFVFKSLNLHRKLSTQLYNLVYRAVCLLKFVEGLELLRNAGLGIGKTLPDGHEGLVAVDRSLDFLCLFCSRHIAYK